MSNMQIKNLTSQEEKLYKRRVSILKAMAHTTRLYILDILKNGPLCVCEINELIDADVSTISKHLNVLYNAELLSRKKEGLKVFYKLDKPCVLDPFGCIEA